MGDEREAAAEDREVAGEAREVAGEAIEAAGDTKEFVGVERTVDGEERPAAGDARLPEKRDVVPPEDGPAAEAGNATFEASRPLFASADGSSAPCVISGVV